MTKTTINKLLNEQQNEIDACALYKKVAVLIKDEKNKKTMELIAKDEYKHYTRLKELTGRDIKARSFRVTIHFWFIQIFGLTFGIKLLESVESKGIKSYSELDRSLKYMDEIIEDEERHETELIEMLDEERLKYVGAVVLGLNDALVELTGALAGFTIAFQDTKLIGLTGLITGISASFSMAASEYLATRHEGGDDAVKSSLYTGLAYVFTVIFLILPFSIVSNPFVALGVTLCIAVLIILGFNFYIAVAKGYNFKIRFLEMAAISLGVAGLSFVIGVLIKKFIGVDI
ncbi:rubrerythrin family protein [Oceanispirochaeta crateris]|uniref:Rubrerythrin family protein n=1 Tax=Oceanispirochaeta crateris TaxID=2518645 RepID=A0A5C1QL75_9SPIO|nr:VIT1/CCC1 transporter family protein [Oceanispirochaeta crateris]QEN08088.1 rubrerythrin family protein [Oceanispirochaeta crateris]